MSRYFFLVFLGLLGIGHTAEFSTDRIQQDLAAGRISQTDAVYYEALRTFSPEDLPDRYVQSDQPVIKCGSEIAFQVRQNWTRFSTSQQAKLEAYAYRPTLPFSLVSPSGLFRVHYDTSGTDSISIEDLDGSGVPDYAERTAEYFDHAYDVEINQMGFRVPPIDTVDGDEWDAYIQNLPRTYGYTYPDEQVSVSPDRYTSFIRLDNNYKDTYSKGLDGLRVTTAHEFFHVVQNGYIFRNDNRYLMEASAVWMEDVIYDSVNDYINYLGDFFKYNDVPFNRQDNWHEYGLALWFHFLDKRYQGMNITRRIWEALVEYPPILACDNVLQDLGSSFGTQLALYYGWNYLTGTRADTIRFYPEGHLYPEVRLDGIYTFTQDTMLTEWVRPTAARYFQFNDIYGSSYILIPVNTGSPSMLTGECSIPLLLREDSHSVYTEIWPGLYTGLLSEDSVVWGLTVVVGDLDGFYRMIAVPTDQNLNDQFGSLAGLVWDDANRDGIYIESEEFGIPSVRLSLTEAGEDGVFGTEDDEAYPPSVTQSGGQYRFPALEAGYFQITVNSTSLPDGYVSTIGDPVRTIFLTENTDVTSINFGFAPLEGQPAAFPQPFNPALHDDMKIPFRLAESSTAHLAIYTSSGYQVFDQTEYFDAGLHFFRWRGFDDRDRPVPNGVYLYVIEANGQVLRREKIAVVR